MRYDWRARFGKGLDSVPGEIGWDEALDLVRILRADPSSQLAAAIEGWDYPLERAGWMLADLIDIQGGKAFGKKWKRYRRPLKAEENKQRWGNVGGRTRAQVVEILNRLGHNLPD